jgi:RHS repeat-associated protein
VPANRITTWSQRSGTETPIIISFGYDAANQLTSANATQNGNVVKTFGYAFDLAGNRLTEQLDGVTRRFSYNALNELSTVDPNPQVAAKYRWDAEHRLVSVEASNRLTSFDYDGFGRRVGLRELVDGVEISNTRYIWSGSEICEERNTAGGVVKRFFPLGVKVETGPTAGKYFYTRDHLGSVRELSDDTGSVRARFNYAPYGSQSRIAGDVDLDFGFTGHFDDPGTAFCLTKFRAYDADLGRWLSRDPLSNAERYDPNVYLYAGNKPIGAVDPEGTQHEIPTPAPPTGPPRPSGPPDPKGPTERPPGHSPTLPAPPKPAPEKPPGPPYPDPKIPGPPKLPDWGSIPGYWKVTIICGVLFLIFLPVKPVPLPA